MKCFSLYIKYGKYENSILSLQNCADKKISGKSKSCTFRKCRLEPEFIQTIVAPCVTRICYIRAALFSRSLILFSPVCRILCFRDFSPLPESRDRRFFAFHVDNVEYKAALLLVISFRLFIAVLIRE